MYWGGPKSGSHILRSWGEGGFVHDGELGGEGGLRGGVDSAGTICLLLRFCVDYHKIFPATRKIVFRVVIFMCNSSIS